MYQRFLNTNDYISIVSDEALNQLIRGNETRLFQAEESAEASIREYLVDNYEIDNELNIGKSLRPYNPQITYPVGAHFYHNEKICVAMRSIHGCMRPSDIEYWKELEYSEEIEKKAVRYLQLADWKPGDIVSFNDYFYECMEFNGINYNDIRLPGLKTWELMESYDWKPNVPYRLWDVVKFDGKFFALTSDENVDQTINPFESDNWGQIGDYDPAYPYQFVDTEYVVYNDQVYYPIIQPTADELIEGFNIMEDDPRNANIKQHMLSIAVYKLHRLISPNNISSSRITDYEASLMWLRDANRCKINPGIPRKLDEEKKPVTEFAIATFAKDYDPNKNPWQI